MLVVMTNETSKIEAQAKFSWGLWFYVQLPEERKISLNYRNHMENHYLKQIAKPKQNDGLVKNTEYLMIAISCGRA